MTIIKQIEPGLAQLITNPDEARMKDIERVECDKDPVLTSIQSYIETLLKGVAGRADCPYIFRPLRDNSIFVRRNFVGLKSLKDTLGVTVSMFRDLAEAHRYMDIDEQDYSKFDPIIVLHAFPEGIDDPAFGQALDTVKRNESLEFVSAGRMLTQLHDFYPKIPSKAIGFNCKVPMLAGKRMNHADCEILSRSDFEKYQFDLRFNN